MVSGLHVWTTSPTHPGVDPQRGRGHRPRAPPRVATIDVRSLSTMDMAAAIVRESLATDPGCEACFRVGLVYVLWPNNRFLACSLVHLPAFGLDIPSVTTPTPLTPPAEA